MKRKNRLLCWKKQILRQKKQIHDFFLNYIQKSDVGEQWFRYGIWWSTNFGQFIWTNFQKSKKTYSIILGSLIQTRLARLYVQIASSLASALFFYVSPVLKHMTSGSAVKCLKEIELPQCQKLENWNLSQRDIDGENEKQMVFPKLRVIRWPCTGSAYWLVVSNTTTTCANAKSHELQILMLELLLWCLFCVIFYIVKDFENCFSKEFYQEYQEKHYD